MGKLTFVDFTEFINVNGNITGMRATNNILHNENGPKLDVIPFIVNPKIFLDVLMKHLSK